MHCACLKFIPISNCWFASRRMFLLDCVGLNKGSAEAEKKLRNTDLSLKNTNRFNLPAIKALITNQRWTTKYFPLAHKIVELPSL